MKNGLTAAIFVSMFTASTATYAGDYVGTFCSKFDDFDDTWVLSVEQITDNVFQATGKSPTFDGALDGGLVVGNDPNTLQMVLDEADANGDRAVFAVTINLPALNGTASWHWTDQSGNILATIENAPFSQIACGDVVATSIAAGESLPAQVGKFNSKGQ